MALAATKTRTAKTRFHRSGRKLIHSSQVIGKTQKQCPQERGRRGRESVARHTPNAGLGEIHGHRHVDVSVVQSVHQMPMILTEGNTHAQPDKQQKQEDRHVKRPVVEQDLFQSRRLSSSRRREYTPTRQPRASASHRGLFAGVANLQGITREETPHPHDLQNVGPPPPCGPPLPKGEG